MKQRRDVLILLALFLALVVFTILGPGQATEDEEIFDPTTYSSSAGGALALLRWTQSLGYDVRRLEYREFAVDAQTDALFILGPSEPLNRTEAMVVLDWVELGGTLILAEERPGLFGGASTILEELDLAFRAYEGDTDGGLLAEVIENAAVLQPALNTPPVREVQVRTSQIIQTERDDVALLVGLPDGVVLLGLRYGAGYIYVSSAVYPFTNDGLDDEQNAALVLNLLRNIPEDGRILFDEYHHGYFTPPSLRTIVLSTPWGWALIYALAVIAMYLILTGRRFGRPIPLREEVARRSSAEYVESMADLFRRGGKRDFVLKHYYTTFKRRLARPYGVNPNLDDAAFVEELARYRDIDTAAMQTLLKRLRVHSQNEDALLRVVAESDAVETRRGM